jgi:hypothetical protein
MLVQRSQGRPHLQHLLAPGADSRPSGRVEGLVVETALQYGVEQSHSLIVRLIVAHQQLG